MENTNKRRDSSAGGLASAGGRSGKLLQLKAGLAIAAAHVAPGSSHLV